MAGFQGYRCWTLAGAASLPTEAVVASRALFLATHAPLKIYRSDAGGRRAESAEPVTEEAVVADFLNRKAPGGVLLMPVIGESGTGKSHLVRWVKERTDSTERRQVIYLRKTETSLRSLVKVLSSQVDNKKLAQLAADVDTMSSGLDQATLERALINRLQEALAAAVPKPGPARVLYGRDGLQVLLQDPYVSNHLRRPNALISRLAKSILTDRGEGEADRPLEFIVEDLPLDLIDAADKAAAVTREMLELLGVDPELQVAAAGLLNEHLPTAVSNATLGGVGRLQEAMLEVRREYARLGKEIILLIEDFAVIQGFQGDLLDAIIEVAQRDGREELAPIRTLMAVTSGYYESLPDTVRTRVQAAVGYVYDLDAQFDPQERMGEIAAFVGRYLNAARLGPQEVEKHATGTHVEVPNACDRCDFVERCHEAFGRTAQGHGLYPFNESTLRRAIRARPPERGEVDAFNPRVVIGEVVKKVLAEYAGAIAEGQFPSPRFAEEYRVRRQGERGYSAATREETLGSGPRALLNSLDRENAERHATFLEFWGDAPAEVVNLPPAMHEAFSIRRLDVAGLAPPPAVIESAGKQPGTPLGLSSGELTPAIVRALENVEEWATRGGRLGQATASELRAIIRDAVVQRCNWNSPLMPDPGNEVLKAWPAEAKVVSIVGASAEREATAAAITFTPSPENSQFFQGLLRRTRASQIQESAQAWRRLADYADRYQGRLQSDFIRYKNLTDEQLTLGIRASLVGATLAGKALPGMNEATLLGVVFDEGKDWDRADAETCAPAWLATLHKHRERRPTLVANLRAGLGIKRGSSGAVRMIDAARALPMLRAAVRQWGWSAPEDPAPWIKEAVTGLGSWKVLLDEQLTAQAGLLAGVRQFLPPGTSLAETIDAVSSAVRDAREAGVDDQPAQRYEQLQELITAVRSQDRHAVDRLEKELTAARDPASRDPARILAAARDRGQDTAVIRNFLSASHDWLSKALKAAELHQSGAQLQAEAEVRDLLRQWAAVSKEEPR